MILAEAVSGEEGAEILDRLVELKPEKGMVSPYMNHHFVEALLMCGKKALCRKWKHTGAA